MKHIDETPLKRNQEGCGSEGVQAGSRARLTARAKTIGDLKNRYSTFLAGRRGYRSKSELRLRD